MPKNQVIPRVCGTFTFEGKAAQIILDKQAAQIQLQKPVGKEKAIKMLLCELYNSKHNCNDCS